MNIDKFKRQHVAILDGIARLRETTRDGITENAEKIASMIIKISSVIKLHLVVEDSVLYPEVANSSDAKLSRLGERYQYEMKGISEEFFNFATHWNLAAKVAAEPERFRAEANQVLRVLFDRMQREDSEFYPAIEASANAK
ncbi:hemerythrin domain-containing protein [Massilia sp. 2TAF26]|uniref:hemerythrin domain-containing protein n=1 Tax=Massilia sp. 2TAF26 TaxID=3233012 RepID=UPI003F96EA00